MTPEDARSKASAEATALPEAESEQALRQRAEARVERTGETPDELNGLSPEAAQRALHELRVHQIELEMQNEELRRAQEELEASRERYFDLYDLAPVGYFKLSENGLILEANLTAAKLLGVARSDLVKQPLSRFIFPEDQDIHYRHRKQLLETGVPQSWELRLLKLNAAPFWARVEATTAQGTDGLSIWRAVVSDISERKLQEEERAKIEAQNRQLQKAEGFGRMAAAIAHRFNNNLTAVIGNVDLALGDLARGERPTEELTDALHAARQAADVSKLMLTYLGQTHVRHESLDLSEVCRQSLPLLQAAMPIGMVLDTDLPSTGPAIRGNMNQLQQVLTNLFTNAWEAGGGGRNAVHLTVREVAAAEISAVRRFPVDWRPQDNAYACLEVVDEGSGIADQDIEKLFDPFFSSKFAGRGLGLSVVLGIVRAHRGTVTVQTEPGRGSTFRVYLPVSAWELPSRQDQTANAPEADGRGTVLLVEDELILRKVGEAALKGLGFEVLLARDGIEAVDVFRLHQDEVRCVICDVTMPRMGGWETLAALRKLAPSLLVILTSGYDEAHVMEGEHCELPQGFLSKPYRLQELNDVLGRALDSGKKPGGF